MQSSSSIESFIIVIDDFKCSVTPILVSIATAKRFWNGGADSTDIDGFRTVVSAYFPAYQSSLEVGDRRGWILIASSDNDKFIKETVQRIFLRLTQLLTKRPSQMALYWNSDR